MWLPKQSWCIEHHESRHIANSTTRLAGDGYAIGIDFSGTGMSISPLNLLHEVSIT